MPLYDIGSGRKLHVDEKGSGKPMLFIHGWPTGGKVWKYQLEGLSDEHRVLAVDLPGFGRSPPLGEKPTVKLLATDVKRLIDGIDLTDVFLIGWSLGAGVVMSYCQHFGRHRLRAIGLVDDCPMLLPGDDWEFGVDTPWSAKDLEEWVARFPVEREALLREFTATEFKDPAKHASEVEFLIGESMKSHVQTAIDVARDVFPIDFRESLKSIEVPTLLLYGAHSKMTTPKTGPFMEKTIPNANLVVFEESGHNLMLEEPERFNRVVGDFAKAISGGEKGPSRGRSRGIH